MTLRVLTYNIHKGFSRWGRDFVLQEIRDAIRATGADLVLLQEVVGESKRDQQKHAKWPDESQFEFLADTVWPHFSYGKNAIFTERHHGNAILSKYPIKKWSHVNLSTHRWEQRGLLHCEVDLQDHKSTVHIVNVHLDLLHMGRKKQIRQIQEYLKKIAQHEPLVLGGDFNDWTCRLTTPLYEETKLTESYKELHGYHALSFPSSNPILRLDRVYSRSLKARSAMVLREPPWDVLSDHLPILVDFEISPIGEGI